MAGFTYKVPHQVERDYIRFHIRDTVQDKGPLPNDANFADEEIASVLEYEGTWQRSVAALLETLSVAWRPHPTFTADQFQLNRSHISRGYAEEAKAWRDRYGFVGDAAFSGFKYGSLIRVDAYSDDLAIDGSE